MKNPLLLLLASFLLQLNINAQPDRWQQHIKYTMDVDLDVVTNKLTGKQTIIYTNNSPDTLSRIFIHLYWNAFKPNSMMDVSSRNAEKLVLGKDVNGKAVTDFDSRFRKRIADFNSSEE